MEMARSCSPGARFWIGPLLVIVLTDPESIECVVKQDKLLGSGYLGRKIGQPVLRKDCYTLMETNGEGIVKAYLQLFI
jgi:hypothetical protein